MPYIKQTLNRGSPWSPNEREKSSALPGRDGKQDRETAAGTGADRTGRDMRQHRQEAGAQHSPMIVPDMRPFCRRYAGRGGYENRLA